MTKPQNEQWFCILLIISIIIICPKLLFKTVWFWPTFWPLPIFNPKGQIKVKGHFWLWTFIVYMHTKYENNSSTGSWDMPKYVFSTIGDLVSKLMIWFISRRRILKDQFLIWICSFISIGMDYWTINCMTKGMILASLLLIFHICVVIYLQVLPMVSIYPS